MCDVSFCKEAAEYPSCLISHYNQMGAYNTSMNLLFSRRILDITSHILLAADCHFSPSSKELRRKKKGEKSVISLLVMPVRSFTGPIKRHQSTE